MGVQFAGNILVQANGGPLPIANGGTGQTTAPTAINALLPLQTGNAGKILTTDGTNVSWVSGGSGASAAGSDTQVQYNDSGNFGANAGLTVNKSTGALTSTSSLTSQSSNITGATSTYRTLHYQTAGSDRWLMQANNSAENGTGLGSNFEFVRVGDNGATQNIVYSVARNTGVLDFKVTPTVNGTAIGTGTVTSVSVTSANGVSGTVANNSTTPAITLSLGAITPTSVASTGSISGTSLAITNSLSVGGDPGTSGYILTSNGSGSSPSWMANTGPTVLAATGAFPSIPTGATGVYAGVYTGNARIDFYNGSASVGNQVMYMQANSDGSTNLGFTASGSGDINFMKISRSGTTATTIAFTSTSASFSGGVTASSFTGAYSGSGASLTSLNASNLSTGTVPIAQLGSSGTPSSTTYLRGDNTWANPTSIYEVPLSIQGTLTANAKVLNFVAVRSYSLPASLTGSYAKAGTTASGSSTLTITKNGTSIGSITFAASATNGTFSFTSAVTFSAGDLLVITAPGTADATLADLAINLLGTGL